MDSRIFLMADYPLSTDREARRMLGSGSPLRETFDSFVAYTLVGPGDQDDARGVHIRL
jgi:hypothetical protein